MNKLKELRKQNNLTQSDIASIINSTQRTYSGYELGTSEPNIETLCKLADYYHVSLDYLVGRDFGNGLGYLTETQLQFVKTFLALNQANQMNAVVYVATMLANQ